MNRLNSDLWISTALTSGLFVVALLPSAAIAQTVPAGTNTPVSYTNTAPDQPAQENEGQGGANAAAGSDFTVEVETPNFVKGSTAAAVVDIQSRGGRGGDGGQSNADLNHDGPLAGSGGAGGALSLTLDAPTGTDPNNAPVTVFEDYAAGGYGIRMLTTGGDAGDGGQNGYSSGNGGIGGTGGDGGAITYKAPANPALDQVYSYMEGQGAGILMQSTGGNGGASGYGGGKLTSSVVGRKGGTGGDGGVINAWLTGGTGFSWDPNSGGSGVIAISTGGDGGTGGDVGNEEGKAVSGGGGDAGNGGVINIYLTAGAVSAQGPAKAATGTVETYDANTTPGATVELDNSASAAAIFALSQGGTGGQPGTADGLSTEVGPAAVGGSGGFVSVWLNGKGIDANNNQIVSTTGYNTFGVLAISAGGDGGDGNSGGGVFYRSGGNGGAGGMGGAAMISVANDSATPYAKIQTSGDDSDALVAINMGGGGGTSGDLMDSSSGGGAFFSLYIGGLGGSGGVAQEASISNGYFDPPPTDGSNAAFHQGDAIITTGTYSRGMVVQSVGGGGGRGGDVTNTSLTSSVTIGGKGGSGGTGGSAFATNWGLIYTEGSHSAGIFSQSVGGGGGAGGGALSRAIGQQVAVSVAVGGDGGSGGFATDANAYNLGQVQTLGANAHAMFIQSVGGGGGLGGTAIAESYSDSMPDTPSISVSASVGGKGGTGGYGGDIEAVNSGLLQTQGQDAYGLFAQSVGGGGGSGGDASSTAMAIHQAKLNLATSVGGNGGTGGDGGKVNVWNSGLISTDASTSIGVFAQSVGGGGGHGGHGTVDQGAWYGAGNYSASISVAVGGQGGASGDGNDVTVNNYISGNTSDPGYWYDFEKISTANIVGGGGILTQGDMAAGIMAQSVGGGGGIGGDSSGKGGNGQLTMNVAIGGGGGSGGTGGNVTVHNGNGTIQTYGAQSYGIFAQSVGGGGGAGGNAATGSGDDPEYALPKQAVNLASGNIAQNPTEFTKVTDYLWDWKDNLVGAWNDKNRLQELYELNTGISDGPAPAFGGLTGTDLTIDVGGGAGGKGGSGGAGGNVVVDTSGAITTHGGLAHGIFGQSVGGGGGVGGASAPVTANDQLHDSAVEATMSLGGNGGKGGDGGTVQITNNTGGDLETSGDLAMGIFGQSVGGGGGVAGASTPNSGFGNPMALTFGGAGDDTAVASGKGQTVTLTNVAAIGTAGDHAIGMMAQSIGGGGGVAAIMGTTLNADTGLFESDTQAATQGTVAPTLAQNWLGKNNIGGNVVVNLNSGGTIETQGVNAFGILAQSIGGSGGLMVVDKNNQVSVNQLATNPDNYSPSGGNKAGLVNVVTQQQTHIYTSKNGAVGIVAQSLGGGGVIVNGFDGVLLDTTASEVYQDRWDMGMGGAVTVTNNSDIFTTGAYAHGIFAQVASGTGGVIGRSGGGGVVFRSGLGENMYCGGKSVTTGGDCGGAVTVNLGAGTIDVKGANSWGVVAESEYVSFEYTGGNSKQDFSNTAVNISNGARIIAEGSSAGAILLNGTGTNTVTNAGVIQASAPGGYAVASVNKSFHVSNQSGGTMSGSFGSKCSGNCSDVGAISSSIQNAGLIQAGDVIDLGAGKLSNSGTLSIQGTKTGTTKITGNYEGTGELKFDADFVGGKTDRLEITGTANVGGTVNVATSSVRNSRMALLVAQGGLRLDPQLSASQTHLYGFRIEGDGQTLYATPQARFAEQATGMGAASQAVAGHLQALFDGGANMDAAFTALSSVSTDEAYGATLDTLSGRALGSVGAFRYQSSRNFVSNLHQGCDDADGLERSCAWARVQASSTRQDETHDAFGYRAQAQSYEMGVQTELGDKLMLGGGIAYENGTFRDTGSTARIKGDGLLMGVGLSYTSGPLEISGVLDGGYGWYRSNRTILVGVDAQQASASPELWNIGAHLSAGYRVDLGGGYLRPFAELRGISVHGKAYTETGPSAFNLSVDATSDFALSGSLGTELGATFGTSGSLKLRPFASAAVEFGEANDWLTTASFAGQPESQGFSVRTNSPGTYGRFALGLDLLGAKNVDVTLSYNPEFGSSTTNHAGVARLNWRF